MVEVSVRAAAWLSSGELYEVDGATVLAVYRGVFDDALLDELLACCSPPKREAHGGWTLGDIAGTGADEVLHTVAEQAIAAHWHVPLAGFLPAMVHRHPVGARFPTHVDRRDDIPLWVQRRMSEQSLDLMGRRGLNVVAMVQPADAGGQLQVWGERWGVPIEPVLARGDVAMFDAARRHGVTRVDAGERVVLVAHTLER